MDESSREALGHFLRVRREQITPEQVGIPTRRGRRTPGLRREEVAFLADIGVKWYARLEAGDDIHPSAATLTGIAIALRLSNAEVEYVLQLAGLQLPAGAVLEIDMTVPAPLSALLNNFRGCAVTIGDRILTPLQWNALSDQIHGHSRYKLPVERNVLVRSLLDPDFIAFLGPAREEVVARSVGAFRLNYSSLRPSPLVTAVYDKIKDHPLFRRAWDRRIVAGAEMTADNVIVRNHAVVGRLAVCAVDLGIPARPDLFLRALCPTDEATAAKFVQLEEIGRERAANAGPNLTICR
jgi:hypothetical protein